MFAWLGHLLGDCKAAVLVGFTAVCWMPMHTLLTSFIRWKLRSMNTAIIYGSGFGAIFAGVFLLLSYVSLRDEQPVSVGRSKVGDARLAAERPPTPLEVVWSRRIKVAVFCIALLSAGGAAIVAPIFANALIGYVNYDDGSGLYAPPISVSDVAEYVVHGFTLFPQFTDGVILRETLAPDDCISAKDYDLSWAGQEDDPVDYFCATPVAPSPDDFKATGKVAFWLASRAPDAHAVPGLFRGPFPGHAITPSVENVARYRGAAIVMARRYGYSPSTAPMLYAANPHDKRAEYWVILVSTGASILAVFGLSTVVYVAVLLLYFHPCTSDCLRPRGPASPGPGPARLPTPAPVGGAGVPLPPPPSPAPAPPPAVSLAAPPPVQP